MSDITGFIDCEQCKCSHRPVEGVCVWKLSKDAAFVLDAGLAVLSPYMIDWVKRELAGKLNVTEGYRYVSALPQQDAFLQAGHAYRLGEWVVRTDYPADVLLIETSEGFGLVKTLAVPPSTQGEESK